MSYNLGYRKKGSKKVVKKGVKKMSKKMAKNVVIFVVFFALGFLLASQLKVLTGQSNEATSIQLTQAEGDAMDAGVEESMSQQSY